MLRTISRLSANAVEKTLVGGLATSELRETLARPPTAPKKEYKLPPYLQSQQFRPQRGAFSDEFVRERYIKDANPQDPFNYGSRAFMYFVKVPMWALGASSARVVALFLLSQLQPNKGALALANIEIDIGDIPVGKTSTIIWRGKPVFIRHRTQEEIQEAKETPLSALRDPQTDEERLPDPNWAVFVGVCTHLGCVPVTGEGVYGAYFCPCHGSHYDHSGRIRKGPAPLNLEVPPHKLLSDTTMYIGDLAALQE